MTRGTLFYYESDDAVWSWKLEFYYERRFDTEGFKEKENQP